MDNSLSNVLALINDTLQAIIVIFGSAVVLYNVGRSLRNRITRAFCALLTFVIIVYLTELLVSRTIIPGSTTIWLKLKWIGITMVPTAQFHLSDALLSKMGAISKRRTILTRVGYLAGLTFLGLIFWTDLVVAERAAMVFSAPHLRATLLFPLFALYYWLVSAASVYNMVRARQRGITKTIKQRTTITLFTFGAAPFAVFPYLAIVNTSDQGLPVSMWVVLIVGNLVAGTLFALLTSHIAYFGAISPDRVVRGRLVKFMGRVPLAGSIVLLVYILISRAAPIFGLSTETALGFALVTTVMLVEWAIHAYKRPIERLFHLNDDPDIRRIQQLSERLLTTRDLHQFLESVLAATCEAIRTPTAFVAAITDDGPKLECVVGPLAQPETIWQDADWHQLAKAGIDTDPPTENNLEVVGDFISWQHYWIRPLYNRQKTIILGIFGIRARAAQPDLTEGEQAILERLIEQANVALEDRVLQQEVFAAVEKLLPEIMALQEQRGAAKFHGLPVFINPPQEEKETLVDDPEFIGMVKDALSHYWGGPKLTDSPLLRLDLVQRGLEENNNNPAQTLRTILNHAIELQKPEGERSLTTTEWILYNILELKFVQGKRVRDVARRLAMSESDLYRKQRIAIENVARTIASMEKDDASGQV